MRSTSNRGGRPGAVVDLAARRGRKTSRTSWAPPPDAIVRDGVLQCPRCHDGWMHQVHAEVWRRDREDGDGDSVALSASVPDVPTRTPRKASEFVQGRRQHIEIRFACEQCDPHGDAGGMTLAIVQYKGQTLLRWIKVRPAREGA